MSTQSLTQTAWADHLRGCAAVANEIADQLDLRDDAARQACFATVTIDATKHNVFMRPIPEQDNEDDGSYAKPKPSAAKPEPAKVEVPAAQKDAQAAAKADAQIKDIDPNPTPEKAEDVKRTQLLEAVKNSVKLLNEAGYTPPLTPKSLNELIKADMNKSNLGVLDVDDLEALLKKLSATLDTFKANKAALEDAPPF